ncbi:MAG: hypothetical protein U1U88_001832 [Lawsonella clevelandensis]
MTQQLAGKLVNDAQTAFVDGQMWAAIVLAIIQIVTAIILAFWAPGFHTVKSQRDEEALNNASNPIPIPLMTALDQAATRRHLLVATDFDGTLAPLVSNPRSPPPSRACWKPWKFSQMFPTPRPPLSVVETLPASARWLR